MHASLTLLVLRRCHNDTSWKNWPTSIVATSAKLSLSLRTSARPASHAKWRPQYITFSDPSSCLPWQITTVPCPIRLVACCCQPQFLWKANYHHPAAVRARGKINDRKKHKNALNGTRSIWKMLGPFATASRCYIVSHQVSLVARQL